MVPDLESGTSFPRSFTVSGGTVSGPELTQYDLQSASIPTAQFSG